MKFKVCNQPDVKDDVVEFWLEQSIDGIILKGQKVGGEEYYILSVSPYGFTRYTAISASLGLPLDGFARLKDRE